MNLKDERTEAIDLALARVRYKARVWEIRSKTLEFNSNNSLIIAWLMFMFSMIIGNSAALTGFCLLAVSFTLYIFSKWYELKRSSTENAIDKLTEELNRRSTHDYEN